MPGLVDPLTLQQFASAAAAGKLQPQLGGVAGGGGGGPPALAAPAPGGSGPLHPNTQRALRQILLSDVKSRFSSGTDPSGAKWRPLRFARPNGGDVPLRDTGLLMASFTGGSDGHSAWVGTTHPGANLHNFGGTVRGKGKMLAIPLTKEAKRSGGPRRWNGPLQFQPTRRPRVFILKGATNQAPKPPPKPKKAGVKKAKRRKSLLARAKAAIGNLRKRLAKSLRKRVAKALKRKRRRASKRGGPRKASRGQANVIVPQFLLVDEVKIPARPFMGVSEKAWAQIMDTMYEAALRGWIGS